MIKLIKLFNVGNMKIVSDFTNVTLLSIVRILLDQKVTNNVQRVEPNLND